MLNSLEKRRTFVSWGAIFLGKIVCGQHYIFLQAVVIKNSWGNQHKNTILNKKYYKTSNNNA